MTPECRVGCKRKCSHDTYDISIYIYKKASENHLMGHFKVESGGGETFLSSAE